MFSDVEMMVFMEELEEKIQLINDNVLLLERDGENPGVVQEIFRAAHTIKGSSAVMGYEKMSRLTHEIENLFDRLRQGTMKVTTPMVDVLFEALDTLKALKDEITGDVGGVDELQAIAKIKSCLEGCGVTAAANAGLPTEPAREVPAIVVDEITAGDLWNDDILVNLIREAEVRGYQAYRVDVEVDPDTQMKNVRAFLVFESLQQIGDIIKSYPPADEIQDGKYGKGFSLVLFTKEDQSEVINMIMSISEIDKVEVNSLEVNGGPAAGETISEHKDQIVPDVSVIDKAQSKIPDAGKAAPHIEKTTIKTVRVDVQKLDSLMNLVGELVIDRTRLDRFAEVFEGKYGTDDLAENILEISNHLGQVTTDLQDEIMKARMLPVATVFNRLPRLVRDIAQKLGREINFIVEGQETELDRNVIEIIGDPLIHLIRNAIDHGIEPPEERVRLGKPRVGKVKLKASYLESHIVITLKDDGKGMDASKLKEMAIEKGILTPEAAARMSDRDALEIIMAPGFSTASVVSDVSGRGVGMDIVRSQIEQINGTVEIDTVPGQGTTFLIKLPLTLAIIRALMVALGEQVYSFPLTNVQETLSIRREEIKMIRHNEVIVVRGRVLPLVRISDIFHIDEADEDRLYVVILGSSDRRIGVVVHRLIGEQEIVIKSLGNYLGQINGLSGATILGDGRVALIVDARSLVKELGTEELAYAAN
jgi:two-component system chemotaxis sensor kinase CheA